MYGADRPTDCAIRVTGPLVLEGMVTAGKNHERALRAIAPLPSRHDARRSVSTVMMVLGSAMIVWSGVIHLDLRSQGYSSIRTIGWLFLAQAITAFVLGAVVLITRRALAAAAGAVFLASTIGGLVWSVEWGLFGFQDSFSAPFATQSLGVEAAGAVVLLVACALASGKRGR